ncbi:hypothetical protein BDC45DRAFT_160305 [Circinella umbellata]|nr:hypothetical protein BDC45DRAFT_160305 [Circinella umbellata]
MQCHLWRISRQQRRNGNQDDNDSLQDTLHDEDELWRGVVGPGIVSHRSRKRRLTQAIVDTLPTRIYGEEKQVDGECQELPSEEKKEEQNKTCNDEEVALPYYQDHEQNQPTQINKEEEKREKKEDNDDSSCITNKTKSLSILSTVITLNHENNEQQQQHQLQEQASCVICLESFIHGDVLRTLPCQHEYHRDCIDTWLTKKSAACPLCLQTVRMPTEPPEAHVRESTQYTNEHPSSIHQLQQIPALTTEDDPGRVEESIELEPTNTTSNFNNNNYNNNNNERGHIESMRRLWWYGEPPMM